MINPGTFKLILLFLIATSCYSFGQSKTIEGVVIDAKSKAALAFATIGIKGTTIGTVTNSEGRFILSIPEYLRTPYFFVPIWDIKILKSGLILLANTS